MPASTELAEETNAGATLFAVELGFGTSYTATDSPFFDRTSSFDFGPANGTTGPDAGDGAFKWDERLVGDTLSAPLPSPFPVSCFLFPFP